MRTTVTIDPDTEALLKEEVRRSGLSFKEVLNRSIRNALGRRKSETIKVTPLFKAPFPAEFPAEHLNRVADALDDEETLHELEA
jgi:hypothetical protein